MSDDAIAAAKSLIASHEANLRRGDLDAIMRNMADDVVMVAAGSPPIEGAEACRAMYVNLLDMGTWDLRHDYEGAVVDGASVVLHGVARGTVRSGGGEPEAVANSFLIVVRPYGDGALKAWRAAFGPAGA